MICIVQNKSYSEHKAVDGKYNGKIRKSCIRCGAWLENEDMEVTIDLQVVPNEKSIRNAPAK
jgi:hypothetical protein